MQSSLLASVLALAFLDCGCSSAAVSPNATRLAAKRVADAKGPSGFQLYGSSRVETAMALSGEPGVAPAISYATEAQVATAIETANAVVMQAAQAEATAKATADKANELARLLNDTASKAAAAAATADLASARVDTLAAQAALALSKAQATAEQAAQVASKAQAALEAATRAGDTAATASAASVAADARAASASAAAALAAVQASNAATAAAIADTKAVAADAKAAAAAGDAQLAADKATRAQSAAAAADSAAANAMIAANNALASASSATSAAAEALAKANQALARRDSVKDWGATGDGLADDTAKLQSAIDATAAAGGGMLVFPAGTYRTTAALRLDDRVQLVGVDGAKLLLDYDAPAGYGLVVSGSYQPALALGADAPAGTLTLNVANNLSAGDLIMIEDNRNGARYPVEYATIAAATGTTVTLTSPLRVGYTVANGARLSKVLPKSITIRGLALEQAAGRDVRTMIYAQYARRVDIQGVKILNHRSVTNPNDQIGIQVLDSLSVNISDCYVRSVAGNGTGIVATDVGFLDVSGNAVDGYMYGALAGNTAGATVRGNTLRGVRTNGARGIKLKGTQHVTVTGNNVAGFDSGLKLEDCGRTSVVGNTFTTCGANSASSCINASSVYTAPAEHGRHIVSGNVVSDQIGEGIYIAPTEPGCVISNNTVQRTTGRGINSMATRQTQILGNKVIDWGTAGGPGVQGIVFHETNQVIANQLYRTDDMVNPPPAFAFMFTAISPGDGTMFVNNVCTTPGTGFASTVNLDKVSQNYGNVIVGYGQKVMWGTAPPTTGSHEVGDRVMNSAPAAGQPSGWVCVTAGSPGVWKSLGTIGP